jgi:hypothetical protein
MRPNINELNALHKANDCVMMSTYQLRIKQSLCIVKSVLNGIASLLAGQQITYLSFRYFDVMMYVDWLKKLMGAALQKVLPCEKRTRGALAHEFASDSSKNKVTE